MDLPRWGSYTLDRINAGEVELWLRSLALAKSSCAKIRNIMSVLFNHGIRHEICNTIRFDWCDRGAKRKKFPAVLSASEVQQLIASLGLRERTLVLLDARHRLADERTVCSEMAGYQLPIKRDQRHTVDRVSGSWTVQDRGVPETDSARRLPGGSAEDMAGVHTLPKTR